MADKTSPHWAATDRKNSLGGSGNGLVGRLNAGAGSVIAVYADSNVSSVPTNQPSTPEASIPGTATLLVTLTFPNPAFGAPAGTSGNPATVTAGSITQGTPVATGTPKYAYFIDPSLNRCFIGSCGPAGDGNVYDVTLTDLVLGQIVAGVPVSATSGVITRAS